MKLNFKKAGARILLVVFFSSLLIISCEKDDEFVQPDAKTKNQEFFKHQKTGGDEFKSYILECLAQADDSLSFTGDFVKTYGLPQWDCGMSFNVEDRNSLIIPILDKTNKSISALYYLKYSGNDIETYLFMNDHDDAAYSYLSRMIQYFEKIMNLKISNDDIIVTIKGSDGTKKTKARSEIMETCYSWEQLWIDSNGKSHYDPYKECFIHIEVRSDFHTSRGDWNLNSSGNYKPNDSYNGGSGNGNGEPEPRDPLPVPPVVEDDSWKGTKADCVKIKLEAGNSNSIIDNLLAGFNLDKSTISLTFYVANVDFQGKTVSNGKCKWDPNTNRIYIYLSENRLEKSSLEVARTILHECFHAYLFGKLNEDDIHNGLAPEPDFVKDFENYSEIYGKGNSNSAQHNYMASMYINFMTEGLKSFFNSDPQYIEYASNNSSMERWDLDSMLEGLAWEGLHGTDTWKDFKVNNPAKVDGFNLQLSYFVNNAEFPKDCD